MRVEIEALRDLILSAEPNLMEGIKWKENDRTIATFKGLDDILQFSEMFHEVVTKWIKATT